MINFENIFGETQMTNMMIVFQTSGPYDQMGSRGMDDVDEEPKRRLPIRNGPSTMFNDTWQDSAAKYRWPR